MLWFSLSDGDGETDILWRNNMNGKNSIWYMDGVALVGGDYILRQGDMNWKMSMEIGTSRLRSLNISRQVRFGKLGDPYVFQKGS